MAVSAGSALLPPTGSVCSRQRDLRVSVVEFMATTLDGVVLDCLGRWLRPVRRLCWDRVTSALFPIPGVDLNDFS